ncbi:right-handed parallel beta-helix repeat-containing protein [Anaerocellum danielii]|uniref:Right-handed parallel beta-helix repeat-containing protein n=1 Tax=Anaerocellum danielii TaxID=1387557 RepID=A0ABZ0TXN2_9FIRM|nr:right-handed parallel beta-helix repeat-containing protein [Caldicellulosiruptor danielii]WPX07997.1 right-handed parallel beta-helix repeat-containing protein [Caldicellulosiruptor danielii]WPX07998.1 right-handed parallel beta-helix repeat-containing protein [Caldicellulosiruptor danielii]WPX07999.1 right-handed parallel beta-helix repeat-containing protein [Caldicellulosiruptor danielii]
MSYRKILSIVVSLIMVISLFTGISLHNEVAKAATLLTDDFEDGNRDGWSTSNGSWRVVVDGSKVLKQASTGSEARAYTGSSDWSNYAVEAKVKVLNVKDSSSGAGVIVRYKNSGNFYAVVLRGSKIEIGKKLNSKWSTLTSKSFTLNQNAWYNVKLEVSGNELIGYVNGSQVLSASDSSIAIGKAGLIADRCVAEFDDVIVNSSVSGTAPTPAPTPTSSVTPTPTPTPTLTPTPTETPTPTSTPVPTQTPTVTPTPTPTPTTVPTPAPTPVPGENAIYVAPGGSPDNPGTIDKPTTLEKAITIVKPGQVIYMRGGTYKYSVQITIERNNNGTSSARKCIYAFPNERPILDFSSQPYGNVDSNPRGLQINGSYWHIKGLEVMGAADNGIFVGGSYNIIEQCEIHHNRDSGLQISRYISSATKDEWPSYNLILNCTSHDNMDPDNGEDADGFACKLTAGPGNVFKGCVAYFNVDDGWDLYTKSETGAIGEVLIEDCVAFGHGQTSNGSATSSSDGNGFKLGGSNIKVNHTVRRCIAFNNNKHGFTYNSNPGSITVENCTGYNNGLKVSGRNFYFEEGTHVLKNCLSYKESASSDLVSGTVINCVLWSNRQAVKPNGQLVTDNDFYSLTPTITRNSDGSLNLGDFLKPKPGSGLEGIGAR